MSYIYIYIYIYSIYCLYSCLNSQYSLYSYMWWAGWAGWAGLTSEWLGGLPFTPTYEMSRHACALSADAGDLGPATILYVGVMGDHKKS